MKAYAVLKEKENLKLLCFRGGYLVVEVTNFYDNISGKSITNNIKKELNIQLRIDENKNYRLYKLELKTLPLYFNNFFKILRHFIKGILIVYE